MGHSNGVYQLLAWTYNTRLETACSGKNIPRVLWFDYDRPVLRNNRPGFRPRLRTIEPHGRPRPHWQFFDRFPRSIMRRPSSAMSNVQKLYEKLREKLGAGKLECAPRGKTGRC